VALEPDQPERLIRLRLSIAYDGAGFSGWAAQPGLRTVEHVVASALGVVLRIPEPRLTVAGRTDSGVHAHAQVAHVDVPPAAYEKVAPTLVRRLAGILPDDVRLTAIAPAPPDFDARFGALWRRYEYRISDADYGVVPHRRHDTLSWPRRLDVEAMSQAAALLVGEHDFAAFCRHRDGATTRRGLRYFEVVRELDGVIVNRVEADAFCHSMVRSLVGALIAVGEGRRGIEWPASLLTRTTRADDVAVAPAYGLALVAVGYPPDADLAARVLVTRQRRE
jgi:tRNA pseudouridine38-40 synthase